MASIIGMVAKDEPDFKKENDEKTVNETETENVKSPEDAQLNSKDVKIEEKETEKEIKDDPGDINSDLVQPSDLGLESPTSYVEPVSILTKNLTLDLLVY